jgi:SAM-dependent methyltransferase
MLNERAVADLYDALHAFEARFRARRVAYPVHKTLRFDGRRTFDVYDWIIDRVGLPEGGAIVDAGCGVGFGTLLFAERTACRVTGISVSPLEIASARETARRRGLDDRAEFRCAPFEDLPEAAYDLAVAVESLKHSLDLPSSVRALLRSLRRGGTLVIVEDVVEDVILPGADADCAACVARDWHLLELYNEADYRAALAALECHLECDIEDLSGGVRPAERVYTQARLAAIALLLPIVPAIIAEALRAYRGGLCLERLYAAGATTYLAFVCRKQGSG